jgi:hypothetical protein
MKFAMPMLLVLFALGPVGSASADTVVFRGTAHVLGEKAEANGDFLGVSFTAPPRGFNPSGGVVLTDGKFNSDVLFYSTTIKSFILESATKFSLTGDFTGFTFLKETGKLQKVGQYFGLGNGELRVRSAVTPLPPTWTIMLTGLVGLGFVLYRRKRSDGVEGIAGMAAA